MKIKVLLPLILGVLSACALGQNVRYSAEFPSISNLFPYYLQANVPPNSPILAVCHSPANQVPCSNTATTYTSLGAACPAGSQDTPDPNPSACQSTGDAQGNIAFWAPIGTYDYTVCVQNHCFGPYTVTLGGGSGSVTSIGTTAPLTGGTITTTGTIACPTCITSTSPGFGIAHFAGATQNVTSSAVDLSGSDIINNLGVAHLNSGTGATSATVWCGNATWCSGGFPSNPQIGDTLRFNVNGDGLWDVVNFAQPVIGLYAVSQLTTLQAFGTFGSGTASATGNNNSTVVPTATAQAGLSIGQTAGASLNTVIAANFGENGSTSTIGMEAFYRWSFKAALGGLTNARYWFGLGCHTGGGTGNNGAAFAGTTAYASDTPNKSTVGFLYSAGVVSGDFQAEAVTAGGSQTAVDTHVVADTNPHLFEMTTNSTGSSILYWIDGINVATISTNLPPPANTFNSWGDLFFTGDNKNTSTAISLTFYSMQISLK